MKRHINILLKEISQVLAGKNSTLLWFMKVGSAQFHWQASAFTGIHYIFKEQERTHVYTVM